MPASYIPGYSFCLDPTGRGTRALANFWSGTVQINKGRLASRLSFSSVRTVLPPQERKLIGVPQINSR